VGFSLQSNDFTSAINRIQAVISKAMESSDPILKDWAQNLLRVDFVFNNESIEQLENNLHETKKWNLFNLVDAYADNKNNDLELLKVTTIIVFIYFQEAYFRLGEYSENIVFSKFKDKVYDLKKEEYQKYKIYFDYLDELPYRICKEIYSDTRLNEIRIFLEEKEFSEFKSFVETNTTTFEMIKKWEETFEYKQKIVSELENKLEHSKQTYDFVLLNKGFKELYEQKKLELKERREGYSQFGATLVCVPLAVIIAIIILILTGYEAKLASMWFLAIPITTLMLFLFYFTRVGLQHVRSVQSQMMQLELRMALCQFIHNYAEDSEKLHAKNKAGFEKFENIIFSPLVSSDDKIPTTFDGIEQLAKLVSEFRR
jgi:hypothetical protein